MRSKARFTIALSLAVLLGGALVWMAIAGSLETYAGPAQVKVSDETYRLNGVVSKGAPVNAAAQAISAEGLRFQVEDQEDATKRVWVHYRGGLTDTFQAGREIVVTGKMESGTFVAKRDTLLTKCPSKFVGKKSPDNEAT